MRSRTFDWERWKAPDGFVIRRRTKAVAKPDEQRLELTYTYRWQDPVDGAQSETVCFALNLWPPETYLASAERNGFEPREFDERTYVSDAGRERMWAFVAMTRR